VSLGVYLELGNDNLEVFVMKGCSVILRNLEYNFIQLN